MATGHVGTRRAAVRGQYRTARRTASGCGRQPYRRTGGRSPAALRRSPSRRPPRPSPPRPRSRPPSASGRPPAAAPRRPATSCRRPRPGRHRRRTGATSRISLRSTPLIASSRAPARTASSTTKAKSRSTGGIGQRLQAGREPCRRAASAAAPRRGRSRTRPRGLRDIERAQDARDAARRKWRGPPCPGAGCRTRPGWYQAGASAGTCTLSGLTPRAASAASASALASIASTGRGAPAQCRGSAEPKRTPASATTCSPGVSAGEARADLEQGAIVLLAREIAGARRRNRFGSSEGRMADSSALSGLRLSTGSGAPNSTACSGGMNDQVTASA